jgi:hypothetical protein
MDRTKTFDDGEVVVDDYDFEVERAIGDDQNPEQEGGADKPNRFWIEIPAEIKMSFDGVTVQEIAFDIKDNIIATCGKLREVEETSVMEREHRILMNIRKRFILEFCDNYKRFFMYIEPDRSNIRDLPRKIMEYFDSLTIEEKIQVLLQIAIEQRDMARDMVEKAYNEEMDRRDPDNYDHICETARVKSRIYGGVLELQKKCNGTWRNNNRNMDRRGGGFRNQYNGSRNNRGPNYGRSGFRGQRDESRSFSQRPDAPPRNRSGSKSTKYDRNSNVRRMGRGMGLDNRMGSSEDRPRGARFDRN